MFKFLKAIKKLFFNYIDRIRIAYKYGRNYKLYTIVKALNEKTPHSQLSALIKDDPNCDVLDYALKDSTANSFKIWHNSNMLTVKDVVLNMITDPAIAFDTQFDKRETPFQVIAQQRPDLLPSLLQKLSNDQLQSFTNALHAIKRKHGLDKALELFGNLQNRDLINFLDMQIEMPTTTIEGNTSVSKYMILHYLILLDDDLSLLLDLSKSQKLSREQLIDCLFTEDENGKAAINIIIQNISDSSLKQLFSSFSNENLISFLSMQAPEFAKDDGINCNEDSILHIIAQDKSHLLPCLLEKLSNEQITSLLKIQNEEKDTVLHILAESNTKLFLDLLVKNIQDKQAIELLSIKNDKNHTPLYYAVSNGNLLNFVSSLAEKIDLKSITDFKPFIDLINVKCDGDITLTYMILEEPDENKLKQIVEKIPRNIVNQLLQKCNFNMTLSKPKIDLLINAVSNEPLTKIKQDLKKLTLQAEVLNIQSISNSRSI